MQQPKRIRLNTELRNKISNRMRLHLEQEDTQEKRKFDDLRGRITNGSGISRTYQLESVLLR